MKHSHGITLTLSILAFSFFLLFPSCATTQYVTKDSLVQEASDYIYVTAKAPIPAEVKDKTQAMSLARDAAVTIGQVDLLTFVLSKKTRSKKTLGEAEIPYIKVQQEIRGRIQGAEVIKTRYEGDECVVTLALPKSEIAEILRKN